MCLDGSPCTDKGSFYPCNFRCTAEEYHFDLETPFQDYSDEIKDVILNGTGGKKVKFIIKVSVEKAFMMLLLRAYQKRGASV